MKIEVLTIGAGSWETFEYMATIVESKMMIALQMITRLRMDFMPV
jgi:hypothetical protein